MGLRMLDAPQGSEAWMQARCGKVTASRIKDVMAKTKSGYGASRANYMAELVAERLTGKTASGYTNAAMQRGTDMEPVAIAAYEAERGVLVAPAPFVPHPSIGMSSGASPDGFVGDDGLVEVKCPNTATHIATLRGASIDQAYILQMQWQMACTKRAWCDWASFDDRMPPLMQLHVRRVVRDEDMIAAITTEVLAFLAELDATVAELQRRYPDA